MTDPREPTAGDGEPARIGDPRRSWLEGRALQTSLDYWSEQLRDAPLALTIPTDRPRRASHVHQAGRLSEFLSPTVVEGLDVLGRRADAELPVILAAALLLLMQRHSGQDDVLIGWHVAVNPPDEPAAHLGNLVVLRIDLSGDPAVPELLLDVRRVIERAEAHAELPFSQLVTEILPEAAPSPHPFCQVGLAVDLAPGVRESAHAGVPGAMLDLELALASSADGLQATWSYNAGLFDEATVERMAGHFGRLLQGFVEAPDTRASALPLLTQGEQQTMLRDWNDTRVEFPADRCLHELFEDQARLRPGATAVIAESVTLSYGELARRANQLAHHLRRLGVGPEVRVGICVERSIDVVVGILGILKAGGAYVPLDPDYPEERLAFMLADSRVSVLVSQERLLEKLPGHGAQQVLLDGDREAIAAAPADAPTTGVRPDDLAYVIYTSGSTGRPKGIALRHQGVVNNVTDLNRSFEVGSDARVLAISALSFDMCVYEILGTLAAGGAIVIPDAAAARDPSYLADLLTRHGVTVWNSAPALLEMLLDEVEARGLRLPSVRTAILGGDWVPVTLPDRLKAVAPGVQVVVLGGATEASIHSIVYPVLETDPSWPSIPYGVPMANQRAYLLDRRLQPVPIGVVGELYLGGIGLARGYFEQPDLTAERFLPNAFSGETGDRIYRTGDLARWKPDGNIELLGRIDHQVKIRGHRIELGEINAVLREHTTVQDVVVTALEDPDSLKRLVAYIVPCSAVGDAGSRDSAGGSQAEQISNWQEVYDETYGRPSSYDPRRDFIGWNSSYTGLPLPEEELFELHDGTIDAILALRPDRALEIGCGTGLVLFRVAPHCSRYDASDVSPVVIEKLEKLVETPGRELPQVALYRRTADDFEGVEAQAYDTVILNSVSQHFPSIDYLVRVLEEAARAVSPGGSMFIGDVRSLPHLEVFCCSLELHQAPSALPVSQLRQRIRKRMHQENELFVDPELFAGLAQHLPGVTGVEIRLKRGRHRNEITRFHYDVALHFGAKQEPAASVPWVDWREGDRTLADVRQHLAADEPEFLGFTRVPNARVIKDVEVLERLSGAAGTVRAEELGRDTGDAGIDPEGLRTLADELSYDVDVSWSRASEPGCFDVLLRRRPGPDATPRAIRFPCEEHEAQPWSHCGNNPLQGSVAGRLVPQLSDFLKRRLPDYMVPSAFVFLDSLPLSPNGKLDRKALPIPDLTRPELEMDFAAPRDPVEELLAEVLSEVLGIESVGIHDDFFELGGHSLTGARAVSRARDLFQFEIPLQSLFENPTVAGWAESIAAVGRAETVDVAAIAETLARIDQLSDEEVRTLLEEGATR